ncbi:MAG: uroporphyrinogen-III C-methyltransferase [Acidimicrobiales bacterium]
MYLVGAGPGDPGLLTRRGAEVLGRADVVVHDRLAFAGLLDLAPAGARLVDVGKSPGSPVAQEEINTLLVAEGAAGHQVVRLKGGDPFVFGRGGEEAAALARAAVAFEVVPGVSSAVAVPAAAGIPVTHRGLSTSFTVVTGHSRHQVDTETNWEALAQTGGTIVVLMGVAHRARIAERLMAGGLDPTVPVAAVRWGTRPEQSTVRATLAELGSTPMEPPVVMVIGPVAALSLVGAAGAVAARPLFGRRVVVTRARAQASELVALLGGLGAEVIEAPTIAIGPPSDGGEALAREAVRVSSGSFGWVGFTSANAVGALFDRLHDARSLGATRVAAVGPATARALAERGVVADLVAAEAVAESLVATLGPGSGGRILLPLAAAARPVLAQGLARAGWEVTAVEAYRTIPDAGPPGVVDRVGQAEAVAFTSSSTVANFLDRFGLDAIPPVVACIGPTTAATARAAGVDVTVVAADHTVAGLVAALVDVLGPSAPVEPPPRGAVPERAAQAGAGSDGTSAGADEGSDSRPGGEGRPGSVVDSIGTGPGGQR